MFTLWRALATALPGRKIHAFGKDDGQIAHIVVINLDRNRDRWQRVAAELRRLRTADGRPLLSIASRFSAIDARDARAVASTADVDVFYRLSDQLYVQPDARLSASFSANVSVQMTRQEVAVARSHIEVWKQIANGVHDFVLVLEDDIWFRPGAASAIDRSWRAALLRTDWPADAPDLLYFSYSDADGTAEREDICQALFRPKRGLWFLSGYVLSRAGAERLLRSMPIVGPVDLWMNYRFAEMRTLAVNVPVILQRPDEGSDNIYSVLPYLARAGIVDAERQEASPHQAIERRVIAFTQTPQRESLAMALSMLGLRVRVFDGSETPLSIQDVDRSAGVFDALVDPPLMPGVLDMITRRGATVLFLQQGPDSLDCAIVGEAAAGRGVVLASDAAGGDSWDPICKALGLSVPIEAYPGGAARELRLFRDDRETGSGSRQLPGMLTTDWKQDDSPWVIPPAAAWRARSPESVQEFQSACVLDSTLTAPCEELAASSETFPGNLAIFVPENLRYGAQGARFTMTAGGTPARPYRSAAFSSVETFQYGRFEVEIRPARGAGLVTGFFLHRDLPRQEIDIEFPGSEPRTMLVNVYFNPGDAGASLSYGYRGTPLSLDLGFDASNDFHTYAIDWRSDNLTWLVDGRVVHQRRSWDPTPVPHLRMRLHANLWTPRSEELSGRLDSSSLPTSAEFRNLRVFR